MTIRRAKVKTPLIVEQLNDQAFVGAPALILKAQGVSAKIAEFKDENDVVRIDFNANTGRIGLYDALGSGGVQLTPSQVSTEGVTLAGGSGVTSIPTDSGSDGLYIGGDNLVPADGAAMIRFVNPVGDMPDGSYGGNPDGDLTINADMSDGAAALLLKGATIDDTVVAANIPMIPGTSGAMVTRAHAAPADGDLVAGDLALWFDQSDGAAKLMLKGKSADGTVVVGEVALT